MSVHVYDNVDWRGICDGHTLQLYKDGFFHQAKPSDFIYNGVAWDTICITNYPWGFDMVNRQVNVTPGFPGPAQFEHIVIFEYSGLGQYPWDGGVNDFVVQCDVDVNIIGWGGEQEVEIVAYNQFGTEIWRFGPQAGIGSYSQQYMFPMNNQNEFMEIVANFTEDSSFTIQTTPIGGPPELDWSGVPFPVDYDSNS